MEKLYSEIEAFMGGLDGKNDEADSRLQAVRAHQAIDIVVRKMQILREYLEILTDECLLQADGQDPLPGLHGCLKEIRGFMGEVLDMEGQVPATPAKENCLKNQRLQAIAEQVGERIERLYQLGEQLRSRGVFRQQGS